MKNSEQTNLQNEEGNSIRPDFTHTAAVNIMAEMFQGEELGSSSGIKSTPGISVSDVLTPMEQLEEMEFQEALAASMAEDEGAGGIQCRTETLIIHHAHDAENITQMVQDKNLVQMLGSENDSPCVSSSSSSTCIPETLASVGHHVQESMVHNEMTKGMSTDFAKPQQIED
jgi:hypothetical protein